MSEAKFVYTPPTGDDPEEIEMFGQKWRAGKVVALRDKGWLAHLLGHPHFECKSKGDDEPPASPPPADDPPPPAK